MNQQGKCSHRSNGFFCELNACLLLLLFSRILKKYGALLLHPSSDVRFHMISTVNALCEIVGDLDAEVFVLPIIRPFVRFHPSHHHLFSPDGLQKFLYPAWSREKFEDELGTLVLAADTSPTTGQWTSIAFQVKDGSNDPCNDEKNAADAKNKSLGASHKESVYDEQNTLFRSYLQMVARGRNYAMKMGAGEEQSKQNLDYAIEGSLKLAQQIKFPRQDIPGPSSATLPSWYGSVLEAKEQESDEVRDVRETTAIRSVSALGQVYGLSIMDQAGTAAVADTMSAEEAVRLVHSDEAKTIEAACKGEWGSETFLDPTLTDTSLLLTKLSALRVPPLSPRLISEERSPPKQNPAQRPGAREAGDPRDSPVFKPKIDTVIATSRRVTDAGHTAPIMRLAVSHDQRFLVTGSHDGTCRVWETEKAEKGNGVLESSLTYPIPRNRTGERLPRVNDLVMVEGSHSVATGASDGSVLVWRVDLVSSSTSNVGDSSRDMRRVAGSTELRRMNPDEGEVLAVNQFNTPGASILTYATQTGRVHSWDLRSAKEPFCLENNQDIGFITSLAIGSDRHWAVVGTNRGFISLWDLRFQQQMKLWHHSRSSPIERLATSFVPPPQSWLGKGYSNVDARPYIFAASGPNECAMFDALSGHCSECFRTVEYGNRRPSIHMDEIPSLLELPLSSSARRNALFSQGIGPARLGDVLSSSFNSIKCMVGSTGASNYSFLITGGSDCRIRFWDFSMPSRCYVSTAVDPVQPRPSFERIDVDSQTRLMLCRQAPAPTLNELDSSRKPRKLFQGTRAIPQGHSEVITDLKFLKNNLVSCSRDCTVKLWR
jgi:phosphoinositide-3-kinase regulatory subunit 4